MKRDQAANAQLLYDQRASKYDDSHHPRLARHMVELIDLRPGEQILDLACGTGLVTFPASQAVGETGSVIGVDISTGMLDLAKQKLASYHLSNVSFHLHSIANLDTLDAIHDMEFDVIICCSALVLLEDAAAALKHWTSYLKPSGRLIVDVTHPMNLAAGTAFERVGRRMGKPVLYYREPFQKPEDLSSMMGSAGLHDVEVTFLSIMQVPGSEDLQDYIVPDVNRPKVQVVYDVGDAERIFEEAIGGTTYRDLASPADVRAKAKTLFAEEWQRLADGDGKVRVVDGIFVGIGKKIV